MELGESPLIPWENGTEEPPEPNAEPPDAGARVPNVSLQVPGLVVEYLNQPVVADPLGLPVPFKVAEVSVTSVAALVVIEGPLMVASTVAGGVETYQVGDLKHAYSN